MQLAPANTPLGQCNLPPVDLHVSQLQCPDAALMSPKHDSAYSPLPRPQLGLRTDLYSASLSFPSPSTSDYATCDPFTPSSSSSSSSTSPVPATPSISVADYRFPPSSARRTRPRNHPISSQPATQTLQVKGNIPHPYARLYSKQQGGNKRRKMWNHALEKMLFTPQELSTMRAPHRRNIYTASLEAHVDRLHEQLLSYSWFPVPFEKLEQYHGLNSKTAKSMVAGLHHDGTCIKLKLLELERAQCPLRTALGAPSPANSSGHGAA